MKQFEMVRFRRAALVLAVLIVLLSASLISVVAMWDPGSSDLEKPLPEGFYLGITSGGSVAETELLIDKVKGYVNMVIFTNLTVTMNRTSLEELSDYAFNSGLNFLVFVLFPSPHSNFTYNPVFWEAEAKTLYGDKFMGFYLWDEPGGHQLDRGNFRQFDNTTMPHDYRDAANTYVYYLYIQMRDFIKTNRLFTTDYAVYCE